MAPIRRYLRISKYSVLECRIYLENPSDSRWLLNSRDPVLPRIITAIRPLVLPKLREENERLFQRKKGKPVKDVITEDDFEVAIFLRESRTRHSLLTRNKTFHRKGNQNEAMNAELKQETDSGDAITNVANGEIMIESDSEPELDLHNIPESGDEVATQDGQQSEGKNRTAQTGRVQPEDETGEDEKKLGCSTRYESFNICGWVLCLLITRKGGRSKPSAGDSEATRQPLMEEWISTQAQASVDED
ncbi:hypothetical protein N7461_005598 [Penicillium sp. DV-2018c]|nr:hypothetical protein N7461_005598 [Penicillium sp. DV-2018c]